MGDEVAKKPWWKKSTGELLGLRKDGEPRKTYREAMAEVDQKNRERAERWGLNPDQSLRETVASASRARDVKFSNIVLSPSDHTITYKGESYPLPAHAAVESIGEIEKRVTLTRVALTGVFALALKKSKDKRELFLTVSGDGWEFVAPVDPKQQLRAREFAARINSAS